MVVAALILFEIWSQDVKKAYLPSGERLLGKVYLKLSEELKFPDKFLLEFVKPLYGYADLKEYWKDIMNF